MLRLPRVGAEEAAAAELMLAPGTVINPAWVAGAGPTS